MLEENNFFSFLIEFEIVVTKIYKLKYIKLESNEFAYMRPHSSQTDYKITTTKQKATMMRRNGFL